MRSIRGFRISQDADPPSDPLGGCREGGCVRVCTRGSPSPGVAGGRRNGRGRGHPSAAHSPRAWEHGQAPTDPPVFSPPPLPLGEGVCREPGGETGGGGGDRLVWVGWEHGERPPPHAAPAVPRNRPQRPPEGCTYLVPCAVSLCQGAPTMLAPGPSPSPETAPCVALPHCARALGLLGLVGLSPSWPRWHARL